MTSDSSNNPIAAPSAAPTQSNAVVTPNPASAGATTTSTAPPLNPTAPAESAAESSVTAGGAVPDAAPDAAAQPGESASPEQPLIKDLQVRFKSEEGQLLLMLPPETETTDPPSPTALTWADLWQQLKQRLSGGDRFWQPGTVVHLIARDRLLDGRQLQAIADALLEVQLQLKRVSTSRRQTAVAAATAGYSVEQQAPVAHLSQPTATPPPALADPLYIQTTVRSGVEIRHPGTIVVLGDINPGSSLIADGDILVWGRLRGVAHAGASGNTQCRIMALQMEPTQLRIAESLARAPEKPPAQYYPEVAYVTSEGIRIARSADFAKTQLLISIQSGQNS
ncbi:MULTISPECIES: septum site-determining protein MinC [Trichocoleus]|uniref:Probable septum site-determining protein MinC n=1 Tax=Trichocoleus desertorum GB2-A4 TaxID=2933944 RepID=A0ABV0J1B3_9CYAN|nr:septum site-determining protein MinC [Trichocoleus sp. FACHB-46]MBD1860169.1 septum site-determining protein MinC [Trichocoleus sp. FACHB-46]